MEGLIGKIRNKDSEAQSAGFTSYEEVSVYNYLKEQAPQYATEVTKQLFEVDEFLEL